METQSKCNSGKRFFLKLGVMFYLVGIFRTLSQGDSISSDAERTALRGEEPGYTEVFRQRAGSLNSKR